MEKGLNLVQWRLQGNRYAKARLFKAYTKNHNPILDNKKRKLFDGTVPFDNLFLKAKEQVI